MVNYNCKQLMQSYSKYFLEKWYNITAMYKRLSLLVALNLIFITANWFLFAHVDSLIYEAIPTNIY